ncbi:hypothetical protein E2C01_044272 [Portunus trituberculatus]|uniref:Uncharacterized protein n=1 Tax=Portunus trituberculatus TaxID=210409 RepID=A0A5B7G1U3_PORTR|nr:hypothetical protein [Portunus trituberculatus]
MVGFELTRGRLPDPTPTHHLIHYTTASLVG